MILKVEMIPKSSWNSNLRSALKQSQWDIVRNICYEKAAYGCEICHTRPKKGQLHCHEVWGFDDKTRVQKLVKLEAVCGLCHSCKHIGFTVMQHFNASKDLEPVIDHFLRINKITLDEFQEYLDKELKTWQKRSQHEWVVDISYLEEYLFNEGVTLKN
jgi:hypothetical protein